MKPILMNGESVRGILEGRKTQTRRVMKPQPLSIRLDHRERIPLAFWVDNEKWVKCPYGQVGDRLWVRETHYRFGRWVPNGFSKTGKQKWTFKAGTFEVLYMDNPPTLNVLRNSNRMERGWFKRPASFMPRWASRITLEITGVKAERVQDISESDCYAEGIEQPHKRYDGVSEATRLLFQYLWDSINAKRGYGWGSNPWDFALTFKVVK